MTYSKLGTKMHTLIEDGIQKAKSTGDQVLVSSVYELKQADLPAFFAYQDHLYRGQRFFWSEPGRVLSYVGLGAVFTLEANTDHNRYSYVDQTWQYLASTAIVEGVQTPYTGPILFGGFSFDTHNTQSEKWSDFAHTSFAVPKYMVTAYDDKFYLTSNYILSENDEIGQYDISELEQLLEYVQQDVAVENHSLGNKMLVHEEIAPSNWMDAVGKAAASIQQGEMQKVVLARSLELESEVHFSSVDVLRRLLKDQLNTYVFAIDKADSCFIGATPERLIKRQGDKLLTLSLAGSIGRGSNSAEDEELASFLRHDVKNLHEHELAVDMIRSAMLELCSSVNAPEAPIIRKLKDIQHLATPIEGIVHEGVTLLQAVEALHPTPALGGMPRDRALDAIRKIEHMDRGWYAAPIGWMNRELEGEFAAAIRSALLSDNKAYLFAGCGIVGDSDPLSEYKETALKFKPMLHALGATASYKA